MIPLSATQRKKTLESVFFSWSCFTKALSIFFLFSGLTYPFQTASFVQFLSDVTVGDHTNGTTTTTTTTTTETRLQGNAGENREGSEQTKSSKPAVHRCTQSFSLMSSLWETSRMRSARGLDYNAT